MNKSKKSNYSAPAVDAMLDIVERMAQESRVFNLTELAVGLDLSNNLVFRVLNRLLERGYVERLESGGYRLSDGFFTLGMKLYSRFELRVAARKHLEKLSAEVGETAQLQVLSGREMLVLEAVAPSSDFYLHVTPGIRVLAHCNAYGKVVMAFLPPERVDEILEGRLERVTKRTITCKKTLMNELKRIKKTGVAYDNEEYSRGVFCVGSPVFDSDGKIVGGVGLTGLTSRFNPENAPELEKKVLECAERVSSGLGYGGDFFTTLATSAK
ncbi:MAG: IclR family transcriptional regulator [Kiritimatiellaeota bacterium]|nr:IclR family transcriptional regulator [Kiritimatiellota bacterium]